MMKTRTIGQVLGFAAAWAILGFSAQWFYDRMLPGVPDAGRWPIASLPWLLARANTPGRPWNDFEHGVVWSLAVATLLVPPLVVMILASSRKEGILAWLLSGVVVIWALYSTFQIQYGYVLLFERPRTAFDAFWFVAEPMLWAGAICALGVLIGALARNRIHASLVKQVGRHQEGEEDQT